MANRRRKIGSSDRFHFLAPKSLWTVSNFNNEIKRLLLLGKQLGKQCKQCQTLVFLGSKITADGDCSNEIKRCLLLGRKVVTNLDSIFKSRDITLPTKARLVKAIVFPVVMYGCESWTVKKAECRRIDAFALWCWRRLLRVLGLQGDLTSPF